MPTCPTCRQEYKGKDGSGLITRGASGNRPEDEVRIKGGVITRGASKEAVEKTVTGKGALITRSNMDKPKEVFAIQTKDKSGIITRGDIPEPKEEVIKGATFTRGPSTKKLPSEVILGKSSIRRNEVDPELEKVPPSERAPLQGVKDVRGNYIIKSNAMQNYGLNRGRREDRIEEKGALIIRGRSSESLPPKVTAGDSFIERSTPARPDTARQPPKITQIAPITKMQLPASVERNRMDLSGVRPNTMDLSGVKPNRMDLSGVRPNKMDLSGVKPNKMDLSGVKPNTDARYSMSDKEWQEELRKRRAMER